MDPVGLRAAIMDHERWGNDIPRSLLDKQAISQQDLAQVLASAWGVPAVDVGDYRPAVGLIKLLTARIADKWRAIPLKSDGKFLDVAFDEPTPSAIDAIRIHTSLNVRPHVADPKTIDRLLAQFYGRMIIAGLHVDPRVTSGNFLSSDVLDLEHGEASMSIPVDVTGFDDEPSMRAAMGAGPSAVEAQLSIMQAALSRAELRIQLLEAHLGRDQDVLRRLFGFMVDKGLGTQEEIVELLS